MSRNERNQIIQAMAEIDRLRTALNDAERRLKRQQNENTRLRAELEEQATTPLYTARSESGEVLASNVELGAARVAAILHHRRTGEHAGVDGDVWSTAGRRPVSRAA